MNKNKPKNLTFLGRKHSEETKKKMRQAQSGNKHWNWKGGSKCSICDKKIKFGSKNCQKHMEIKDNKNPNWKGGVTRQTDYKKKAYKKWVTNNLEKRREINRKRRAREYNAFGSYSAKQWEELKEMCGNKCLLCRKSEPEVKLTVDHIVPLSKGGTNNIENIQPLCMICNSKKRTKIISYLPQYEPAI